MSTRGGYRIPDEPQPGAFGHLVVQPIWPLFAMMFAGSWLSWPWFVFNSLAVGSPTRGRETLIAVGGFVGSFALVMAFLGTGLFEALGAQWLKPTVILVLTGWKLFISYWLHSLQTRTFELHRHFGGLVRNGLVVVAAGYFLRPRLLDLLPTLFTIIAS